MIEEIVLHDPVAVLVAQAFAIGRLHIDLVAAVVLAGQTLGGEEDVVVLHLRAEWTGGRVVIPFLHEEHAGLGAGVGLEGVRVQADDGEYATAFGDELAHALVAGVVEAALRQYDGHAASGAEAVEIALDEEKVASHSAFQSALTAVLGALVRQFIEAQHVGLLDVARKRGLSLRI